MGLFELGVLVFIYICYKCYQWCDASEKKNTYHPPRRPSYEAYQTRTPNTVKADKIEGEYDGCINKEFENQ